MVGGKETKGRCEKQRKDSHVMDGRYGNNVYKMDAKCAGQTVGGIRGGLYPAVDAKGGNRISLH